MFKFLLAAFTIASVAAQWCDTTPDCTDGDRDVAGKTICDNPRCVACIGSDAGTSPSHYRIGTTGCTGTDVCSLATLPARGSCVAKGVDDATCAAIDAARSKWDQSSASCVACLGADATGCTGTFSTYSTSTRYTTYGDVCSLKTPNTCVLQGADEATCVGSDATGCTGTDVCSLKTANTCVAKAVDDITCAAIDAAKPRFVFSSITHDHTTQCKSKCSYANTIPGMHSIQQKPADGTQNGICSCQSNADCVDTHGTWGTVQTRKDLWGKNCNYASQPPGEIILPVCSLVTSTCVSTGFDHATCAAIDAAKSKWLKSSASCVACLPGLAYLGSGATGCTGTDVCSLKTANTCVAKGVDDATCAAIDAAKSKWDQSSTSCVACLGSDATGCTGTDVCSLKTPNTCVLQGADEATCVGSDATGCTGTDVCSLKTANTCVAKAVDDVTCAAIDAAKSVWLPSVTGGSCVGCTHLLPRTDALGGTCIFVAAGNLLGARLLGAQNCLDPDGGSTCNLAGGNWGKFCKNNIIAIDGDGAKCTTKARTSGTGCTGTDVCSFKTANTCVAKAADDATCAAIDAAKSKWLESSASCVTCIRDDSGVSTGACTGAWPKGESGNNVCSTTTPNTCVSAGTSDASCAAIDSAFPLFDCVLKKCVNFNELQGILIGERCVHNDATCYTPADPDNDIFESVGTSGKPKWSSVSKKCMAAGTDDSTCAAIDAAKSRWLSPVTCAGAGLATLMKKEISHEDREELTTWRGKLSKFVAAYRGSCVACLVTADCKGLDDFCSTAIPNTCVPFGDATCAANNAATWTMTITPTGITEKVGAAVTQTSNSGTLKTVLQNEYTLTVDVAAFIDKIWWIQSAGVAVTQVGGAAGTLKTDLVGAKSTSVVILAASGVVFTDGADLTVGSDTVASSAITASVHSGVTDTVIINAVSGVTFSTASDLIVGGITVLAADVTDAVFTSYGAPKFVGSACVACASTADCMTTDVCSTTTPNTCVAVGSSDASCAAINFATPKFVGSACVAASLVTCGDGTALTANKCEIVSPPVTCGDGTALTATKCEIISPTDVELAKMCGEGTTYDKEKKKCATDPTSRCTPGLTNTTINAADNSADAVESAGSSHFVSRTATLAATVIVVLFCKL